MLKRFWIFLIEGIENTLDIYDLRVAIKKAQSFHPWNEVKRDLKRNP